MPISSEENSWRCHICHSKDKKVLAPLRGKDGGAYHAVRCLNCGLLSSDPVVRLTPEQIQEVYSKTYYDSGWCDGGLSYDAPEKIAAMEKEARDQRQEIQRVTGLTTGSILDVGCSDGRYLAEFKNAGWQTCGVEVSAYSASQAREKYGLKVHCVSAEEIDPSWGPFDLVRMKHCIEHLPDPRAVLARIAEALGPGGFLVLDTDNAGGLRSTVENSIRAALGRSAARSLVKAFTGRDLDSRYGRLSPPIHLYTFDLHTLGRLLGEFRLEIVHSLCPAQGHPVWFPQLHRYRCNKLELLFRLADDLGGKFNRGEALVIFARKKS